VVRGREPLRDGDHDRDRLLDLQRRAVTDALGERLSVEELHRQVDLSRRQRGEVVDLDDVLVPDRRRRPRLLAEALQRLRRADDLGPQHLDGEALVDVEVLRLVDLPHAAFAEQAHDAIAIGEHLPDQARLLALDERGAVLGAERAVREYLFAGRAIHQTRYGISSLVFALYAANSG